MNIYKLITPVNRYNYVNHPYLKRDLDYYSQHNDPVENIDEFAFMKRKKLSTTIHGMTYNDDYLIPKLKVISNAMKVDIEDRTPLSKRLPEVMNNPYIPFGDQNSKYDELLTASQQMLSSVEPINYFGCRIVGDYLYNFDIGMIFKIIPKDFLARFIDPTLIKESTVYVDSKSAMIMPQKSAFKNIWMDTKKYIPVHPKYVETIDINSLIPYGNASTVEQKSLGVNLNERPPDSYYTTPLPLKQRHIIAEPPVREPVIADSEQPLARRATPFESYFSSRDYEDKKFQQRQQDELNRRAVYDLIKEQNTDSSTTQQSAERKRENNRKQQSENDKI